MAIRTILTFPDPVLRQKAKKVTRFDEELKQLAADMGKTMYDAPGIGLAANQIGVLLQIVVVDVSMPGDGKKFISLVNPVISGGEGSVADEEGCLSVIDYTSNVKLRAPTPVVDPLLARPRTHDRRRGPITGH